MDNRSSTHQTFYYLSKAVMIVPAIILVTAVILQIRQNVMSFNQKKAAPPTVTPLPTSKIQPTVSSIKLNLIGPFVCQYKDQNISFNAQIKNKSAYVEYNAKNKDSHFILKGDCIYMWENTTKGEKICGISPYISIVETLAQFNLLNPSSLFAMIPQQGQMDVDKNVLDNIEKSCQKEEIDDAVFSLPKGVVFYEIRVSITPPKAR